MNKINLFLLIKIILKSKLIWEFPPKKKILIYDSHSYKYLINFFKIKNTHVLDIRHRHEKNQKINIRILIKLLFKLKLNKQNYLREYLLQVQPKLVITAIDNNLGFYKLKKFYNKAKYVSVQNAVRTTKNDIFYDMKKLKKNKELKCDYVLSFNNEIGKFYKAFCSAKIIPIGSILSNNQRKIKNKKYDLMFISTYRPGASNEIFLKNPFTTFLSYRKKENELLKNLSEYANEKNLILYILGSKIQSQKEEFLYFKNLLGSKKFKFIPNKKGRNAYKIIDQSKLTISTDSTLGYEAGSRGNNTIFFSVRGNKKKLNSSNFGWPLKKTLKGKFWSNDVKKNSIKKLIEKPYFKKNKFYPEIKKELKDVMVWD